MRSRSYMTIDPRTPRNAVTEHAGFSPTSVHQAPSAVRRSASRMNGELHPDNNQL